MTENIRPMEPMDVHRAMRRLSDGKPISVRSPAGREITIQRLGANRYSVHRTDTGARMISDYATVYKSFKTLLASEKGVDVLIRRTDGG